MVGRQLPFFSLIIPFWLIAAYDGVRGIRETWPVLLVAGASFAIPQFVMSNYQGPYLVDVVAGATSIICVTAFMRMRSPALPRAAIAIPSASNAWIPWLLLCVLVLVWGLVPVKTFLNHLFAPQFHIAYLDGVVQRVPPVVASAQSEPAVFTFNILSATGTSILIAALLGGLAMGCGVRRMAEVYVRTLRVAWPSLLTIATMLGLGYLTRYSGLDAILGLAFARSGVLYPLFGTLLGWLGVALTGSDTSSNVLFGSLQKITATQLGLSATLMAAANSSGGVMGKMIDMQSIVVASAATRWFGHEGRILRFVFLHSLVLATLVGLLVMLQAYVPPFTHMVP
jgi:lactate permease